MQQIAAYNVLPDESKVVLPDGQILKISYNSQDSILKFTNGSFIQFAYLNTLADIYNYSSIEMNLLIFDEVTQFTGEEYEFLKTRVRTGDDRPLRVLCASNPGDIGHNYFKERFISSSDPNVHYVPEQVYEEVIRDEETDEEYTATRVFIPAKVQDNPNEHIKRDYRRHLNTIADPQLRRALLYGDWDTFMGRVYTEWAPEIHVLPELPEGLKIEDCSCFIGFDWGYHDPAVATWIAYAPENLLGVRHLYAYREIHEVGKTPQWWARTIADIISNEPIEYMILPHDCFSHLGGNKTIANTFADYDVPYVRADSMTHAAKMHRIALLHQLLTLADDKVPYLQFLENCSNNIRTIPTLPYSKTRPEEIDDKADDHCLHGDTLIQTDKGRIKIKDLVGTSGYLWSLGKLEKYHSVRQTGIKEIYELSFLDDSVVKCSGEHLFLTTTRGWVRAIDLRPSDMIQLCSESDNYFSYDSTIQQSTILSLWSLLSTRWRAFASNCLSISQRKHSFGLSYSSQRSESNQQSDRKLSSAFSKGAFKRAFSFTGRSSSTKETLQGGSLAKSRHLASFISRETMAQKTLQTCKRKISCSSRTQGVFSDLFSLWQRVYSALLSSKNMSRPLYTSLSLRTKKSSALVYNLEVENTHCFSIEGGITVHNCFDSTTYALMVISDAEGYILDTTPGREPEAYNTNDFTKALRDSEARWA